MVGKRPSLKARALRTTTKTLIVPSLNTRIPVEKVLLLISNIRANDPTYSSPLDPGGDSEVSQLMRFERLRSELVTFCQQPDAFVEMEAGVRSTYTGDPSQDKTCFLTVPMFKAFCLTAAPNLTIKIEDYLNLLKQLSEESESGPSVEQPRISFEPIKVLKKPQKEEPPLNIDRELFRLRQLQKSLKQPPDEEVWDRRPPIFSSSVL